MTLAIALALHVFAAVIWVGGMYFAYHALRPVAAQLLNAEQRLSLWQGVLKKFFPRVWIAVILLLITGLLMIRTLGGMGSVGIHVHIMLLLGLIMMLMFMHVFFSPFKKLSAAVVAADWDKAAAALNQIRVLILINLILGILTVLIASAGRYIAW